MTGKEKLLLAISEIDEDLIYEASINERPRFYFIKKLSTVAAVFLLIIGLSLILRLALQNNLNGGGAGGSSAPSEEDRYPMEDNTNGSSDGKEENDEEDDELTDEENEDESK